MEDLISVIVPYYSSEKYIRDCIESVLKQTYKNWELLLIDDGSKDNSKSICKELCEIDQRIRLIEQEHKGVSAARNLGIKAAKGKYLFFLDSDDAIHPKLLEILYILQEKNHSVIAFEKYFCAEGEIFSVPKEWDIENDYLSESNYSENDEAIDFSFFAKRLDSIGGKMIRTKEMLGIWFDERLTHGEDTLLMYQLVNKGANVSELNANWYYYRIHEGGASKKFTFTACQSRYYVLRYICDHEVKSGRWSNAIRWESNLIEHMKKWHQIRAGGIQSMQYLVSVIIPVYNSAYYIRECVESVLRQTYGHLEIVLIDDGSLDDSDVICEELLEEDKRIHFIRQFHKGVSEARNRGIKESKGKYLFFLDSDDIIHPQLIENLFKLQEKNQSAIAASELTFWIANGGKYSKPEWNLEEDCIKDNLYLKENEAMRFPVGGIGGKMILRDVAMTVCFNSQLTHGEDTLFLYQILCKKASISILNRKWYYYRQHAENVSNSYSVDSCKNMYNVWRYIRIQEEKKGRGDNAVRWERIIISNLSKWYEIGARSDADLEKYIKGLANVERKEKVFLSLNYAQRETFYLTFYNSIILKIFYRYMTTLENMRKKAKWNRKKVLAYIKRKKIQLIEWIKWIIGVKLKWKMKRGIAWIIQKTKWMNEELKWRICIKLKWKIRKGVAWIKYKGMDD